MVIVVLEAGEVDRKVDMGMWAQIYKMAIVNVIDA